VILRPRQLACDSRQRLRRARAEDCLTLQQLFAAHGIPTSRETFPIRSPGDSPPRDA
jgi:hypothetical protein